MLENIVSFVTYPLFSLGELDVFLFPHFLLLQESGEFDQIVLYKNILLPQLSFLQFEFLLLPVTNEKRWVEISCFKKLWVVRKITYI